MLSDANSHLHGNPARQTPASLDHTTQLFVTCTLYLPPSLKQQLLFTVFKSFLWLCRCNAPGVLSVLPPPLLPHKSITVTTSVSAAQVEESNQQLQSLVLNVVEGAKFGLKSNSTPPPP